MSKCILLLVLISSYQAFSNSYSQTKINLNLTNTSIKKALKEIEKKSDYRFLYNDDILIGSSSKTIEVSNASIDEVMTKLLKNTNLNYQQNSDNLVIISKGLAEVAVSGTVKDEKGESLPGVSVKLKGSATGVSTDFDGKFSIVVPDANSTLVFTYIGFATLEVPVAGKKVLDVVLKATSTGLSEVVVIGYGTQKKSSVTGSIAKITAEAIEERPIARVEQALQGQMAGVSVRNTSGSPGADINIRVRGAASISGDATPLYVVDGVPLDNLSGINPADIQSIDVLKDAASAAIYGSRGSNGVVFVTTKRGKQGAKPVISVSAYTAASNIERKVDVMTPDQWIEFNKKWLDRQWVNATGQSASVSQAERIAYAQSLAPAGTVYDTRASLVPIRASYGIYDPYWGTDALEPIDWQDEIFRTAPVNDFQINATGATEGLSYSISGGILDQKGVVVGSSFKRYSLRANLDAKINDRIKVGFNLAPSYGVKGGTNVDGKDNAVARSLSFPGWVLAGSGNMAGADPYKFYGDWGAGADNVSPYVQALYNDRTNTDVRLNTSLTTTVNVIKGLDVNGLLAWNYRGNKERTYSPTWVKGTWNAAVPGQLSSSRYTTLGVNTLLTQATANYTKEFGKHSFNVLGGLSQETYKDESTDQGLTGFPNDKTWVFNKDKATTVNFNTIGASSNALISYFSRVQYNYDDKYLLAASMRYDGSSKFGPNNRWGFFPSVSAGWLISQEDFLKDASWLSTAKLRASWGQAGNDRIGNSTFISNMSALNYPLGDLQTVNSGYVVGNISNSLLRWEKSDSYNLGVDFGILRDRIFMSADVYYKRTTDLLLNAPVSLTTGYANMMRNIGNVDNKGFEVELNSRNLVGPKLRWSTSFNLSLNRNEITKLSGDNADIRSGQGSTIIQRVGSPINSYYLLQATGVLRESDFDKVGSNWVAKVPVWSGQKPGDTKYHDVTGDGFITAEDYVVAGNYQPKFEWGMTNSFNYKNFDISLLLQGRVGGDLLSIGSRGWNRATNDTKWLYMEQWLTKAYWSEEEPGDGKVPAFFSAVTSEYDTNWMYDASYLRIKNLTLGYTLPVKKSFFTSARLYASFDNVYMWDNYYPGFSPEGATQDNASSDWGAYPQARTLSFGLSASF